MVKVKIELGAHPRDSRDGTVFLDSKKGIFLLHQGGLIKRVCETYAGGGMVKHDDIVEYTAHLAQVNGDGTLNTSRCLMRTYDSSNKSYSSMRCALDRRKLWQ